MKNIIILIVSVLFLSCVNGNKSDKTVSIEHNNKLKFLNEILSDTIDLKLLPNQRIMISDINYIAKLPKSISQNEQNHLVSEVEYLSHHLSEEDTSFIHQQIVDNEKFDLGLLSQYGFNMLNTKTLLKNGTSVLDLCNIVKERNRNYKEEPCYILLDKPIFNKNMNRAYMMINTPHSGKEFLFSKENGAWTKNEISSWVE